jgi:hypothetical protein
MTKSKYAPNMETKTKVCSNCKIDKPLECFGKIMTSTKTGFTYAYECKECKKIRNKYAYARKKNTQELIDENTQTIQNSI